MNHNKAAERVWQARTGAAPDPLFLAYSESAHDDAPFVAADIAGSIAHVAGLHASGLLNKTDATTLITGLQAQHTAYAAGQWRIDPALEDVHMNVEHRLQQALGAVAARLHTGRSRNDQVALDIVILARQGVAAIAEAATTLSAALAAAAEQHADTPWVAETHGQSAQPATLGFLLAAHAVRFHDVAQRALATFDHIGESPLGAGAVAGSTLPLRPEVTAKLLGLRPLRSALLATGTRDVIVHAAQVAAHAGLAASSLAVDLLALHKQKLYTPPAAFTSGSSLMPHKRNPDALELARAKGRALGAHGVTLHATLAGLGLGYHRDFQTTKPILVQSLTDAHQTLHVLVAHTDSVAFDADAFAATLDAPGITATDAAEALVANGVAFRDAYKAVASAAAQALEGDTTMADALRATKLPAKAVEAAIAALTPDPARRTSLGAASPDQVRATLQRLRKDQQAASNQQQAALTAARSPFLLLELSSETILAKTDGANNR